MDQSKEEITVPQGKSEPDTLVVRSGEWKEKVKAFFSDDDAPDEQQLDDKTERQRYKGLTRLVTRQAYVMLFLTVVVILAIPIVQPVHKYTAMRPDKVTRPLVSLFSPNQTDRSVLSWSATSITEIMTFGFGDIDLRLIGQMNRFTKSGWLSFVEAVFTSELVERFKAQQLVLTTVPIDTPVIAAKGLDKTGRYQWIVEMPVIMTYMTNNNVSDRHKTIVRLTIVRVPTHQNRAGIGIHKWKMM